MAIDKELKKAVFLDKDGTIIKDVPYSVDLKKISFLPGVFEGLKTLKEKGYLLILVTNQSGIAKGYFRKKELFLVFRKLEELAEKNGFSLTDIVYCPHHPEGKIKELAIKCNCRKPSPGMILKAAQKHRINLSASWMIGDIPDDAEAGNSAGCRSILINSNETVWKSENQKKIPFVQVGSFKEAVNLILERKNE